MCPVHLRSPQPDGIMTTSSVVVVYEIGLLIIVASLSTELFKRMRLPGLIGPILVGVVIGGPGGLGLVTSLTIIETLGAVGSVLILFMVGLEFEASAFWRVGRAAFLLTTGGVVVSLIVGYLIGSLLGWSTAMSFLLGVVMAPSGTSVIASVLAAEGQVDSKAGQTLLTACIVDDVQGVLLLTVALAMISTGGAFSVLDVSWTVLVAVAFILSSIYIGGRLFPMLISRFSRILSDEVLYAIILGAGLLFAFAFTLIGLAAITGAFIMGVMVPYTKVGEKLSHRLFFTKEVFAAVFFASIGLTINPSEIIRFLPLALLVAGAGIAARIAGGLAAGKAAGFGGRQLFASVLGLAVRAEMSLIIAREAVTTGMVGSDFLSIAATAVIFSMVLITPIFSRLARGADWSHL